VARQSYRPVRLSRIVARNWIQEPFAARFQTNSGYYRIAGLPADNDDVIVSASQVAECVEFSAAVDFRI
jgi:hypothetical protein